MNFCGIEENDVRVLISASLPKPPWVCTLRIFKLSRYVALGVCTQLQIITVGACCQRHLAGDRKGLHKLHLILIQDRVHFGVHPKS